MTLSLGTAAKNAGCNAIVDLLDAGSGAGTIQIRDGVKPASVNDPVTGTLLATVTLPKPAFGDAVAGVATLAAVGSVVAAADGTASWFRAFDSAGTPIFGGTVGTSGADLIVNTTAFQAGGTVQITSGTVTQPG